VFSLIVNKFFLLTKEKKKRKLEVEGEEDDENGE